MTVELFLADGLGQILLNRPDKLNSFDQAMIDAFNARLDEAEGAGVRALLVSGEGRGFCAGRDLSGTDPLTEDAQAVLRDSFNPLIRRLADFPAPTFAAVHGACLGAGFGVAMACDVVFAADDAKLGSPFARLGAVLDSGGHQFLAARVGAHRALELIYSGRLVSGREAAAMGLVNRSMGRQVLVERTQALAAQVAAGPTLAFLASKRIVRRVEDGKVGLDEVLGAEAAAQGEMSRTCDYREGIAAFQQKRRPRFTGT